MNANSIRFAPIISAGLLDAIADREAYQAWYPEYCDYRVSRMLNGREVMEPNYLITEAEAKEAFKEPLYEGGVFSPGGVRWRSMAVRG